MNAFAVMELQTLHDILNDSTKAASVLQVVSSQFLLVLTAGALQEQTLCGGMKVSGDGIVKPSRNKDLAAAFPPLDPHVQPQI